MQKGDKFTAIINGIEYEFIFDHAGTFQGKELIYCYRILNDGSISKRIVTITPNEVKSE